MTAASVIALNAPQKPSKALFHKEFDSLRSFPLNIPLIMKVFKRFYDFYTGGSVEILPFFEPIVRGEKKNFFHHFDTSYDRQHRVMLPVMK